MFKIKFSKKVFLVAGLVILSAGCVFTAIQLTSAVPPNPGHSYLEIELPVGVWEGLDADTIDGLDSTALGGGESSIIVGFNPVCPTGQTALMKAYNGTWYTGDNADITTWNQISCGTTTTIDGTPLLVYDHHTTGECTTASGTVVSDETYNMCRFNLSVCPNGWTNYKGWKTTEGRTVGTAAGCGAEAGACEATVGATAWSNNTGPYTASIELRTSYVRNGGSCWFSHTPQILGSLTQFSAHTCGSIQGGCTRSPYNCFTTGSTGCCVQSAYATAIITQIGCY